MFPLQFVDAIADALETRDAGPHGADGAIGPDVIRQVHRGVPDARGRLILRLLLIGLKEPSVNHYQIKIQNLTIHGDIHQGYTEFTNDQRKIRAILYRDATLSVSLAAMREVYLGST